MTAVSMCNVYRSHTGRNVVVRFCCSLHKRFQDIDDEQDDRRPSSPLKVQLPHDKIISMPEFRVVLLHVCVSP